MELLQSAESYKLTASNASQVHGLAGWIVAVIRGWRRRRVGPHKQLLLVETLSLGGKRQLMLVSCGGENFLVGGGLDSVETIVRVNPDHSVSMLADGDEPCR